MLHIRVRVSRLCCLVHTRIWAWILDSRLFLCDVDIVSSGNGTGDDKLVLSDSSVSVDSVRSSAVFFESSCSSRLGTGVVKA